MNTPKTDANALHEKQRRLLMARVQAEAPTPEQYQEIEYQIKAETRQEWLDLLSPKPCTPSPQPQANDSTT